MKEPLYERYSRQMLFPSIGAGGQRKLAGAGALIVGLGALGAVLAQHMARAGVGRLRVVDRDYVETSNLQRQMLYDEEDVRQALPKAVAAARKLARINSDIEIEPIVADVTAVQAEKLTQGMDLVLDGTDNFATRHLMNDACFKKGIPFVYGGAVSSQGMTGIFVPGATCCFRCMFGEADGSGQTCDTVGVISPIVDIVASFQAVEALKYLVGDEAARRPSLLSLEIWRHQLFELKLPQPKPDCPTCGLKLYPSLAEGAGGGAATLCGRETVQFQGSGPMELEQWQRRLAAVSKISRNPYLLRAELPEGERLVLFPDGRVLVQGTEDLARARTLYDRYIGS